MSERMLPVARSVAELWRWRAAGEPIGLMPRMGALHAGHLALVAAAQARCRRVVVSSIFVNRKQFGRAGRFLDLSAAAGRRRGTEERAEALAR